MPYPPPRPLAAVAVLAALCLPSPARAATLNVPTAAYPTIQSAVTAAANGDTVLLADGAYGGDGNRDVDFGGKSLTVTSQHGAALTTIDCGGSAGANHRGFYLHSGEASAVISGLTIQNGNEGTDGGSGGAIFVAGTGRAVMGVVVQSCVLKDSAATYGGGISTLLFGDTVVVRDCTLAGNTASEFGGGFDSDNNNGGGSLTIDHCLLSGNTAGIEGGGVENFNVDGRLTVSRCTINGNSARQGGGGVGNVTVGGVLAVTDCLLTGNSAVFGGGGIDNDADGGSIAVTGCVLSGNSTTYDGGGINDEDTFADNAGSVSIVGCTLTGNSTATGDGTGIYNTDRGTGTTTLTDDVVYGDTGREISNNPNGTTPATVTYCDVGGGLDAGDAANHVLNADPLFVNAAGGDLHLQPGSPCFRAGVDRAAADHDGQPYGSPPTLGAYEITGQTGQGYVVTNVNDSGGGSLRAAVAYANADAGTTVTFDPTAFPAGGSSKGIALTSGEIDFTQGVTVTGPPNGVYVVGNGQSRVFGITGGPASGPVRLSDLLFVAGTAPADGAPFFGGGGGVAVRGATVALTSCEFSSDTAAVGGGLYNAGGDVTLTSCLITSDTAGDGGGVYNDTGGTLTLTNVFAAGNQAVNDGGAVANHGTLTVALLQPLGGFGPNIGFFGNHAVNDGGGIANDGLLSMTGGGTSGVLVGNGARNGGAVFNAGGAVTLSDLIVLANTAAAGGGGVSSAGGSLTLTGCAVTANGAHDGGGVSIFGGPVTLTSCTFTDNSVGSGPAGVGRGAGLFTFGGPTTLTDDILYGDEGAEIAGPVTASFCDIEGNGGTPTAPDVGGNFSADPLFTSGPFFGPSVRIAANSPVIGRGTRNAPAFLPTDLVGNPYFSPPAIGAVEGPEDAHVLWTNPDGRTIFWDTNQGGAEIVAANYGPLVDPQGQSSYVAKALSTGPNGVSHILWSTPDGRVALGDVQPDGTHVDSYYGPFADDGTAATTWQPVAVSTGGDNVTHLLWDNPNGRTILWDVNPTTGAYTVVGNYDGFSDDGTAGTVWKAVALASGPDGLNHVLWNDADGNTLLWNLDATDDQPAGSGASTSASASQADTSTAFTYPLQSDDGTAGTVWHAQALSVGQDNLPRILWNNPDGRTILWNVASDDTFAITGNYAPLLDPAGNGGFTAVALATGNDNRSHFAWDNPNGETYLWNLLNDGGPSGNGGNDTVSPFYCGIFSDDGTSATDWKAVAISAAQPVSGP